MELCFNLLLPRFIDTSEHGITTDGNGSVHGRQTGSSSPRTGDEGSVSGGESAGPAHGTDVDCVNEAVRGCSSSSLKRGPHAHSSDGSCKEQRGSRVAMRRDKGKGKAVIGEPVFQLFLISERFFFIVLFHLKLYTPMDCNT